MTTVRPLEYMPANIAIDSFTVTFLKLSHAIAGIYMCVLHTRESAH